MPSFLPAALFLAACASSAAAGAPDLVLKHGTLKFPAVSSFHANLELAQPGAYAVAVTHASLGSAHAVISSSLASCGGAVASSLPPNLAFLVLVRRGAGTVGSDSNDPLCLRALLNAPGVLSVVHVPYELRLEPALLSADGSHNGALTPLRAVALSVAPGAARKVAPVLQKALASAIDALCAGTCEVVRVGEHEVHLTAWAGACAGGGERSCTLDSPAACGCTLPVELARLAAAHPEVLFASRVEQVYAANAFGRALVETPDVVSWPFSLQEDGKCTDSACDLSEFLPFSALPSMYGPQLRAAAPLAVTQQQQQQRSPRLYELGAASAAAALANAPVPRRLGRTAVVDAAKVFASIPSISSATTAHRKLAADSCSAMCASGACDFGFSRCRGLVTPIAAANLTGAGQIVHIADTGLDPFLPFFFDPMQGAVGPPITQDLPDGPGGQTFPPLTAARKVVGYWAYADGTDNVDGRGHGTHTAGSTTGDSNGCAALDPADRDMLEAYNGGAPKAQLLVADIGCSTPAGCARSPVVPARGGACNNNQLCVPNDLWDLFGPAFRSGSRVSTNSWGGQSTSDYTVGSQQIDAMLYENPTMLVVFAAANAGGGGFYTISSQGVAKNVLTVGALSDGIYGHLAKIAGVPTNVDPAGNPAPLTALYQGMDGRACGAVVLNAVEQNASSLPGGACPAAPPSDLQCYAMAVDGQENLNPPIGGFSAANQYGGPQQVELALCCGCSLRQVVDGCLDAASGTGGTAACAAPGALSLLLQGIVNVYNSRWPTTFSSLGPAADRRIKPDIAAPGFEIMSARSGQYIVPANATAPARQRNRPYDSWACQGGGAYTWTQPAAFEAVSVTVPVTEIIATLAIAPLIEPIRVDAVQLVLDSVALPDGPATGWIELWIVSTTETGSSQMFPVRAAVPASAVPQLVNITVPGSWHMGSNWAGALQLYGMPGMTIMLPTLVAGQPAFSTPCFTDSFGNAVRVSLVMARGGANAYASVMSGTSMATPIMAGMAVLVNQYYEDGFLGAGAATPGAGFVPSAALVKATLANSATAAIEEANDVFFGLKLRPRWQLEAQAGFGVPSLPRGLSFAQLGSLTRAAGQLPTLLLPGLVVQPPVAGKAVPAVEPTIMHGQEAVFCVDTSKPAGAFPNGGEMPLTVTIAWTDPPVSPAAAQQLVNNLDLFVIPPFGPTATGNSGNSSSPNQGTDTINNIETVSFAAPVATTDAANGGARLTSAYKIVVRGADVPTPQAYALVVTGPGLTLIASSNAACPATEPSPSPQAAPSQGTPSLAPAASSDGVALTTFVATVAGLAAAVGLLSVVIGYQFLSLKKFRAARKYESKEAEGTPLMNIRTKD